MNTNTKQAEEVTEWRVSEYNEHGGYDCMTGAICIQSGSDTIATLDGSDYGQASCHQIPTEGLVVMQRHAQLIVESVNSHAKLTAERSKLREALHTIELLTRGTMSTHVHRVAVEALK